MNKEKLQDAVDQDRLIDELDSAVESLQKAIDSMPGPSIGVWVGNRIAAWLTDPEIRIIHALLSARLAVLQKEFNEL